MAEKPKATHLFLRTDDGWAEAEFNHPLDVLLEILGRHQYAVVQYRERAATPFDPHSWFLYVYRDPISEREHGEAVEAGEAIRDPAEGHRYEDFPQVGYLQPATFEQSKWFVSVLEANRYKIPREVSFQITEEEED